MNKFLIFLFALLCLSIQAQDQQVWMNPNRGQWHENINYKINIAGGEMLIEQNAFTYLFHNVSELKHNHEKNEKKHQGEGTLEEKNFKQHVIKTNFIGSNKNHSSIEKNPSQFYKNYFIGNDKNKWKSEIYSFSNISYPDFYNGIEMNFEGKENSLKYSFILQAQADPTQIKYEIIGANNVKIDKKGSLIIEHTFGTISESKPIAWTLDKNGNKTEVAIAYKLTNNVVSFSLPNDYKHHEELIIDPSITFSSYTGSSVDNWGCTATPDAQGNLFAGGTVFGAGYPTTAGALSTNFNLGENIGYDGFDISLSKFNSNGTALLFSTYVGGSKNECPNSMICSPNGELYIMGVTSSDDFPLNGVSFQNSHGGGSLVNLESSQGYSKTDIYVVRISPTGNAIMNGTFVGGSGNDGINPGSSGLLDGDLVYNYGDNFRGEITFDNTGNVVVASSTRSTNFPTQNPSQAFLNGIQDAVLFKLNPSLSTMLWSTYYGGNSLDCGNAVTVNSLNEVYLTGGTKSPNLNVPGGHSTVFAAGSADGYLTRFNGTNGAILSGTYIGTNDYDQSFFVQVDIDDFVYVYGQTFGIMPISAGLFGNPNAQQFIRKFDQNLTTVIWNTKIGGSNQRISPTAFLVSNCYEIYISGWGGNIINTNIATFPITADAFQTSSNGDGFYISVYDPDMTALQYATFMGGPSDDHVDGGTSRFDKNGRIYHAVCSACGGNSNGFVSTPGVVSTTNNSGNCNLAAFKFDLNSIVAIVVDPSFTICIPDPIQFINNSVGGDQYFWDFGDNTSSTLIAPSHVYSTPGNYTVKLVVYDTQQCQDPDSMTFVLTVGSSIPGTVNTPPTVCKGVPVQLQANGGVSYIWSPANLLNNNTLANPVATVFQNTIFTVIIFDSCSVDTLTVNLNVFNDAISVSNDTSLCIGNSVGIEVFGALNQTWTPNTFITNNNLANPFVNPITSTTYVVTATTLNACVFKDSVAINVFNTPPIPIIDDSATICFGEFSEINVSGATTFLWSPNQFINTTVGDRVFVSPPNDFKYYCDFTNACGTLRDSIFIDVKIPAIRVFKDTIICLGQSANLSANGGVSYVWSPSGFLNDAFIPDVVATPTNTTNFRVIGIDQFGCKDTAFVLVKLFPINTVDAGPSVVAIIGENVQLVATTNNVIGEFSWSPSLHLSCTSCFNPIANPDYNTDYWVYFTDTNGCITKDIVHIDYKGIIYIPNTFTPDGNRFNQIFKAYGEGILDFEMMIFDRWGEVICTLNSMEEYWDGTYKGNICQDGTYTWKLTYSDITREYKTLTGHVNLLK